METLAQCLAPAERAMVLSCCGPLPSALRLLVTRHCSPWKEEELVTGPL